MKIKVKLVGISIVFICFSSAMAAKNSSPNKLDSLPLKKGDQFPDYMFVNLINYKHKTAGIEDFKDKIIILDFWSTGCSSCIESWPKVQAIQEEFKDKVQIIQVNPWENEEIVRRLIQRRKKLANFSLQLPVVYRDTNFLKMFDIVGVPYIVWIDQKRQIKSITYGDALTAKNVRNVLQTGNYNLHEITRLVDWNFMKPMYQNNNGGDAHGIVSYSVLSSNISGFRCTEGAVATDSLSVIFATRYPVDELYKYAYSDYTDIFNMRISAIPSSRVVYELKDSLKIMGIVNGEFQEQNCFNYQHITGKSTKKKLQEMMQVDLKNYFGLNASIQKRTARCLVLRANDTNKIAYKDGDLMLMVSSDKIRLNKVPVSHFIKYLENEYYYIRYPIVDATGFSGLLGNIMIDAEVKNFDLLNKYLNKYGISLKMEDYETDMLVLSAPEGWSFPESSSIK